jgi:hypothetical protein
MMIKCNALSKIKKYIWNIFKILYIKKTLCTPTTWTHKTDSVS